MRETPQTPDPIRLYWDNKREKEEGRETAPIIVCYNSKVPGNLPQSAEENIWS
jgi:hypothetical protein